MNEFFHSILQILLIIQLSACLGWKVTIPYLQYKAVTIVIFTAMAWVLSCCAPVQVRQDPLLE